MVGALLNPNPNPNPYPLPLPYPYPYPYPYAQVVGALLDAGCEAGRAPLTLTLSVAPKCSP